jgi:threonine/homoserine/homoserine lactone efflux protein
MESKVYVSPDDVLAGLGKALSNPMVWVYFLAFPYFLIRYRRRHRNKSRKTGAQ